MQCCGNIYQVSQLLRTSAASSAQLDGHLWKLLAAHNLCEAVQSLRVKLGSVVCLSQIDSDCISQI